MNKNTYLSWLNKKIQQTPPDGPINESRRYRSMIRNLRAQLDYHQALLAAALSGEAGKSDKENQPYTLEPKSGLMDFKTGEAPKSIKYSPAPPAWSYNVKNTLGLGSNSVYEEKIDEGTASNILTQSVKGLPKKAQAAANKAGGLRAAGISVRRNRTGKKVMVPVAKKKQTTALAVVKKDQPLATTTNNPIVLKKDQPLATTTNNPIAKYEPPIPEAKPIPHQDSPLAKPIGDSEKVTAGGNQLGSPERKDREQSKWTKSIQSSRVTSGIAPFGIEPGSGKQYGGHYVGQVAESTSMKSLINQHIDKFMKSRHGKKLKNEAQQILTSKK